MHVRMVTSSFGAAAIESVEHLNDEHGDTVAFIARAFAGATHVADAHIDCFEPDGLSIRCTTTAGTRSIELEFPERAETVDGAFDRFYEILRSARERAPAEPLTSIERELTPGAIPTWITRVTAVADITPRIRQVTVAGGLDGFVPLGPDQFVYVLGPPRGRQDLTIDGRFSWSVYQEMHERDRPVGAYYTIRRCDPRRGSLDLWVVLHGHDGDGEQWARTAAVGSPVGLWGPRDVYKRPASCRRLLLLGDETAIPALAAILENLGVGDAVTAIVSVPDRACAIDLFSSASVSVSWVSPSTTNPNPLLSAVQNDATLLTGDTYVWGAAESRDITAVRRFVRDVVGLSADRVSLTGYWRRSVAERANSTGTLL